MGSRPVHLVCASCGFLLVVLLFGGIIASGWMPPLSPSESATEIAARYAEHTSGIRVGAVMMLWGAGATVPVGCLIAAHIRKVEGEFSPLTYIQVVGCAGGLIAITMPVLFFGVAAFRPERGADLTLMLNDLGWIPFIINGVPAILQAVSWGIAILSDRREEPPFPRWLGYFNFWAAFSFLPAFLLLFFTTGPFAWNGLLSFWLPATLFGGWFLVASVMLIRAAPKAASPTAVGRSTVVAAP